MSEPEGSDPQTPQPEESTPEDRALFQHVDSPYFPIDPPHLKEAELEKLFLWVENYLVPTWVYSPSSRRPWCLEWPEHPDAVSLLHALYRAYQELINTEQAGMAGPSTWMHHHLLPTLAYLRSPDGPFTQCVRGSRQSGHELPEPTPARESL